METVIYSFKLKFKKTVFLMETIDKAQEMWV